MAQKLTRRIIDGTSCETGQAFVWDTDVKGFGLRVTAAGAKAFVFQYRTPAGKTRRTTIADVRAMELEKARKQAKALASEVAQGNDPLDDKRAARAAAAALAQSQEQREQHTFERVAATFIEKYAVPNGRRSWQETERIFNVYAIPQWKGRPVEDITRRDVRELVYGVAERAPIMANRVLAALRKLFNWCAEHELIAESPAAGVRPPAEPKSRDRVLTDAELTEVWRAANRTPYPFGPFMKLAILTAQRKSEISSLRWRDVDMDNATWTIPREMTKADRAHVVPLSEPALEVLRSIHSEQERQRQAKAERDGTKPEPPNAPALVFTTNGETPFSGFSKAKRLIDGKVLAAREKAAEEAGSAPESVEAMPAWTIHDMRRTAASGMAALNFPPHVLSRVLNHAPGVTEGVTAIYNRHSYASELRRALEAWGRHVVELDTPEAERVSNVVAMQRQQTILDQ